MKDKYEIAMRVLQEEIERVDVLLDQDELLKNNSEFDWQYETCEDRMLEHTRYLRNLYKMKSRILQEVESV